MIHDLKPYPAYKESGVPWLGEVPEHWKVVPNRSLFAEVKERNRSDEQLLSVTIAKGVILQSDLISDSSKKDSSNEDKSNYKFVRPGDIVYNKMRAWQGAVGVSKFQGIVSPAYIVVHPRNKQNSKYFHYLLRTPSFAKEAERWSYGITSDQWSLRPEHFKMIYCSLPLEDEQEAIVRYLDYMDRRIRHYINSKHKLIKLLEEQKQAIIHRAVTRGLDPDVRLKDSGVEWLGDVPEHWEVTVAKRLSKIFIPQRDKPELNDSGGIPWVTLECIGDTFVRNTRFFVTEQDAKATGSRVLPSDSVVASCIGRFGISSITTEPVIINQQIQAYIPKKDIKATFLRHFVQASKIYFEMEGNSTTLAYADREAFENLPIVVPPLEEQKIIVEAVDTKITALNSLVEQVKHEIFLLKEYRTRLISDVVTGKIDVREAAANLPMGTGDAETFEDETEEVEENADEEIEEMTEEE